MAFTSANGKAGAVTTPFARHNPLPGRQHLHHDAPAPLVLGAPTSGHQAPDLDLGKQREAHEPDHSNPEIIL